MTPAGKTAAAAILSRKHRATVERVRLSLLVCPDGAGARRKGHDARYKSDRPQDRAWR